MAKRTDVDTLRDIREAIRRTQVYVSTMTFEQFLADIKTQDSVVRNLEVMGEATKNLSVQMRNKYPDVPWKDLAGVRDKLIHHYFGVNFDIVWNIVTVELPVLASQIEEILRHEIDKDDCA